MCEYESGLCEFPHPRNVEDIKFSANYWGMRVGKRVVEAFKSIRVIR